MLYNKNKKKANELLEELRHLIVVNNYKQAVITGLDLVLTLKELKEKMG